MIWKIGIIGEVFLLCKYKEDISTGLVFWFDLGKTLGVKTPNIDATIILAYSMLQIDFYSEGLTLKKLGSDKEDLYLTI